MRYPDLEYLVIFHGDILIDQVNFISGKNKVPDMNKIIEQIELHSVDGIRKCFSEGISPNDWYHGEPLIYELISEYTLSSRFKDCINVFVQSGIDFPDKPLLAVLQDDSLGAERNH